MRKIIVTLLCLLFLTVSLSLAGTLEEAEKALDEYINFIITNIDKSYNTLSEEEKQKIRELFPQINRKSRELCKEYKIPHSTLDWLTLTGVPDNPLVKVKPNRFTIVTDNCFHSVILKKVYGDSVDVMTYYFPTRMAPFNKIEKKARNEKEKYFCYVTFGAISCPIFYLEKELMPKSEIIKCPDRKLTPDCYVPSYLASYEMYRRLLIWLEKEFGPKGRGLIPAVIEKTST